MPRRKVAGMPVDEGRQEYIRTLEMQISALEQIVAMQNGAFDAIGREIEQMNGGMVARIVAILERHGTHVRRPQQPLQ